MSSLLIEGQARLEPIARAIEALSDAWRSRPVDIDDGNEDPADANDDVDAAADVVVDVVDVVDVDGLLWAWRKLQPRCHRGAGDAAFAGDDAIDVDAIVDVLGRRPSLLAGGLQAPLTPQDDDPRGTPHRQQVARCLADALTLGLERQKLLHGLTASSASLRRRFASPDIARATLQALIDADPPRVHLPPLPRSSSSSSSSLAALSSLLAAQGTAGPMAVHVLVGDVTRVLDLLSPGVRRLRVDLALLGRDGVIDDDDLYRGLDRLYAREPGCVAERRGHPDEFADDGRVFVIDSAALHEDGVDRRARSLVAPLKKARVVVIGVTDVLALPAVLRAVPPRSITVLGAACSPSSSSSSPSVLLDGTGAVLPLSGDGPAVLSLPWSGLLPADLTLDAAVDVAAWVGAVWRARIADERVPSPTLLVTRERERSAAALEALAALGPLKR